MAGTTLDIKDLISEDELATEIAGYWFKWDRARDAWKRQKVELRQYIYATDTSDTSNDQVSWSNKTHIPKLCQIRDNLYANYIATMFPKRNSILWEGDQEQDEDPDKVSAIKDYMDYVTRQKEFEDEVSKLIYDYIDYGNAIGTVQWVDETTKDEDGLERPGYVGPRVMRYSPFDVVINPMASSFRESPKIVRSLWTIGEAKKVIEAVTATEEDRKVATEVFSYLKDIRDTAAAHGGEWKETDEFLRVDGFESFRNYLDSGYIEVLSFYGDFYDRHKDVFYKNCLIVVVDRHKVILKQPHPLRSGQLPIHHSGWRIRQDNPWAMGPLDNLVGMQYRINHVENNKADLFDLTNFPPLKIKGQVEDFEWGPFERIYVDSEGDVELMSPKVDILNSNIEIQTYEQRMEEMAGSPKEAMGFRTPGEKTKYEVQRLENAASRVFQSKIKQFEKQILEPLLNDCLAVARIKLDSVTIRILDDEFKTFSFREINKEDLSALGKIKPVAARHFAEQAEMVQNLTNFFGSALGQDPSVNVHFSGLKLAELMEDILAIEDHGIVQQNIRISEQADSQRLMNAQEEQVMSEIATPAGINEDDFDDPV